MAATATENLAGHWKLDGSFAPSGETLTADVQALPGQQWRLVLPKDVRPEGMHGDIVMRQKNDHEYVSVGSDDVEINITLAPSGKANLLIKIDNSKGFARFGYQMTRIAGGH